RYSSALVFALAIASASALNAAFKLGFHRVRPDVVPHLATVSSASFPSGHGTLSAATYLTLGAMLSHAQPRPVVRVYLLGAAVLLSLLIGLSRLYLGVHWPSDVLAGWCLGSAWALGFWLLARWIENL